MNGTSNHLKHMSSHGRSAVERIHAIRACAVSVAETLEAQLMEQMWVLRQQFDNEQDYTLFCEGEFNLRPEYCRKLVSAWEVARKNRSLRELATRKPDAALQFIRELANTPEIIDNDEEVARLLTLPPRKRSKKLRQLIDTAAGSGMASLPEPEPPAARRQYSGGFGTQAINSPNARRHSYERLSTELLELITQMRSDISDYPPAAREKLVGLNDQLIGAAEELAGDLMNWKE